MAIIFPLDLPESDTLCRIDFAFETLGGSSESPFSFVPQTYDWGADRWLATLSWEAMQRTDGDDVVGTLLALNGREGSLLLGDPLRTTPAGTWAAQSPLVNGAAQAGKTLAIDGITVGTTCLKGDYFQLGSGVTSRLHRLTKNVTATDPGVATFTRATAAACRLSTGLWKLDVASGVPRSHYREFSPGVYTYGGYLAEVAATQIVTPSASVRDMTNAAWVKVTMTTAKTSTGIDGVASSCTRVTATGANSTILQTLVAAAASRTYSCFMKRVTGTGQILIQQGATTLDVTALINSSTFTMVQLNASVLNSAFGIKIVTSGDAIDVDCNQFEQASFASTPIPAAGTRSIDLLTYAYSGNALNTVGSVYAELSSTLSAAGGSANAISLTDTNGRPLSMSGLPTEIYNYDGVTNLAKTGLTSLNTGVRKRAASWGGSSKSVTGDGATVATGAFDGTMGAGGGNIGIGVVPAGTLPWCGTIKNVRIYQTKVTDDILASMTGSGTIPDAEFMLPLTDSGNGAVSIALSAGAGGVATLDFVPSLRETPANNAAVTLASPKGLFMLNTSMIGWTLEGIFESGISVECVEDLRGL